MKTREISNGGYIGILMLLIGVAIMIFFIVRTDLFSGQKGGKSMLQIDQDAVNKAKDVKAMVEQNSRQAAE